MKKVTRGLFFFLLLVTLFIKIQTILLPRNHSLLTMDDFYAMKQDSVEVLFIGASHIVNGIEPQMIEDITGMKSMSCAIIGQQAPLHIDYLEEALRYQKPKLLVVDIYRFRTDSYGYMPLPDLHESINGMRIWGGIKFKSIWENTEFKNIPEFLFPIIRYHTRWNEITIEDIEYLSGKRDSSNKGYSGTDWIEPREMCNARVTQKIVLPKETVQLLDRMVEMTLKNGIEILFINLPYSHLNDKDLNMYQAIEVYMRQKCSILGVDFDYIDYNQKLEEIGFDYSTDFRDFSHLNNSGAKKVSLALAEYIRQKYCVNN